MSLWIIPCSWLARVVTPSLRVLETTAGSGGLASLEFRIIGAIGMLEQRTLAREGLANAVTSDRFDLAVRKRDSL
jgi:hypothetical protein